MTQQLLPASLYAWEERSPGLEWFTARFVVPRAATIVGLCFLVGSGTVIAFAHRMPGPVVAALIGLPGIGFVTLVGIMLYYFHLVKAERMRGPLLEFNIEARTAVISRAGITIRVADIKEIRTSLSAPVDPSSSEGAIRPIEEIELILTGNEKAHPLVVVHRTPFSGSGHVGAKIASKLEVAHRQGWAV